MNKVKFIWLTAGIVLATVFTLSCSSENNGGGDQSSSSLAGLDVSSSSDGSAVVPSSSSNGATPISSSDGDTPLSSTESVPSSSSAAVSSDSSDISSSSAGIGSSSSARSSSSVGSVSSSSAIPSSSSVTVTPPASSSSGGTTTACTPSARSWTNVTYGTRTRNVMDIKLPSSGNGPWPVIMFVHGGAWQGGSNDKANVSAPFSSATSKGYALASIHYSVIGSGKAFPESVEDVLAAIRFLRAKAADYCLNPDKIGITGFSSGGYFTHIAAALSGASDHGFDNASLGNPGVSSKVQAAVSCSGLSDFLLLNQHVTESGGSGMNHCGNGSPNYSYFGFDPCTATGANKDIVDRSNPIKYITAANCADLPPLLSLHGTADNIVPWKQSELMVNTINSVCGAGRAELYKHSGGHNCPSGRDNEIYKFLDDALK